MTGYRKSPAQKVVVVNGNQSVLGMLETVLDGGHYDMVFVQTNDRAYSEIKKTQPHLVILCVCLEVLEGLQLLTMLKLDEETKKIPVLTYALEEGVSELDDLPVLPDDGEPFIARPVFRMN